MSFVDDAGITITTNQAANYLRMKQPQYNRYERGLRDTPSDVLIRLAALYNTSVYYILELTDCPEPYSRKTAKIIFEQQNGRFTA